MRIDKPLWHEGLILNQQQFQQQDRWTDFVHRQFASAAIVEPWGTLGVEIDEEALPNGRLKLTRLTRRFPDGTVFDTSVSDALPSARDLTRGFPPGIQSVVVLAARPLIDATGSNCRFDETTLARPRRSYREFVKVTDLNGTGDNADCVIRLLFDFEQQADDTICAIARAVQIGDFHKLPIRAARPRECRLVEAAVAARGIDQRPRR
ncbi:type VI secretion system baseplate subunit TssK [Escherichia coli]|nr:type VI secretion system baseplate subunit TssK [Escherichia coli]